MEPTDPIMTITRHANDLTAAERAAALGQRGGGVWITGLSASGKSTLAMALERRLVLAGHPAFALDGDNLRHGLCHGLGFSPAGRSENIRRAGHTLHLMASAGLVAIGAFISPAAADRDQIRALFQRPPTEGRYVEIHVNTPLAACEARDPKGLYRRARAGEIAEFTGISAPYDPPAHPELRLDLAAVDLDAAVEATLAAIAAAGIIPADSGILPAL